MELNETELFRNQIVYNQNHIAPGQWHFIAFILHSSLKISFVLDTEYYSPNQIAMYSSPSFTKP